MTTYYAQIYPNPGFQSHPFPSPDYETDEMFPDHTNAHQQYLQPRTLSHSTDGSHHSFAHGQGHAGDFASYHQHSDFDYNGNHATSFEAGRAVPVNYNPTGVSMNVISVDDGHHGEEVEKAETDDGTQSMNHSLNMAMKRESHMVGGAPR
jgi:hypothetical protein